MSPVCVISVWSQHHLLRNRNDYLLLLQCVCVCLHPNPQFILSLCSADVIHLSSGEDDLAAVRKPAKEDGSEPSGAHTDDALNRSDIQGRVLVNLNHPEEEEDVFLLPQLARAVKPHQVQVSPVAVPVPKLILDPSPLHSPPPSFRSAGSASCTTT